MFDSSLIAVFLGVIMACLVVMTVALLSTAWELRGTLRRLNTMLPGADATLREARHSLRQIRRMLVRTNHAARSVETVIERACEAGLDVLDRWQTFTGRAQTFLTERFGNGRGAEPHPHHPVFKRRGYHRRG